MASYTVNISTSVAYDFEFGQYFIGVTASPANIEATRGDTIRFVWQSNSGEKPSLGVGLFDSRVFTSTATLNFSSVGQVLTKTVKSDAAFVTDSLNISMGIANKSDSTTTSIRILNPVDAVPDSFSFGSNRSGFPAGSTAQLGFIRCTGVNTGVTCRITNRTNFEFRVNNGAWRTANITVQSGDLIYLRCNTPQSFSTTVTTRLYLNDVYDAISVTTGNEDSVKFIPSGIASKPVRFSDVWGFFGRKRLPNVSTYENARLSNYVRGGDYVPNIAENNAIETSLPLDLDSFIGSGTSMYFETFPQSKGANANTISSNQRMTLSWTEGIDYVIGFGQIRDQVEYRITLTNSEVIAGFGSSNLTLSGAGSINAGTWSGSGKSVTLTLDVGRSSEGAIQGELTIEARFRQDNSTIITAVVPFTFGWYGE
jgi:hypothetical protein